LRSKSFGEGGRRARSTAVRVPSADAEHRKASRPFVVSEAAKTVMAVRASWRERYARGSSVTTQIARGTEKFVSM
jgi:hypothetical protein